MAENTKQIKDAIVRGYRAGLCDKDGGHIPDHKKGRNGKGSRYINIGLDFNKEQYDKNYELAFGHN